MDRIVAGAMPRLSSGRYVEYVITSRYCIENCEDRREQRDESITILYNIEDSEEFDCIGKDALYRQFKG